MEAVWGMVGYVLLYVPNDLAHVLGIGTCTLPLGMCTPTTQVLTVQNANIIESSLSNRLF